MISQNANNKKCQQSRFTKLEILFIHEMVKNKKEYNMPIIEIV